MDDLAELFGHARTKQTLAATTLRWLEPTLLPCRTETDAGERLFDTRRTSSRYLGTYHFHQPRGSQKDHSEFLFFPSPSAESGLGRYLGIFGLEVVEVLVDPCPFDQLM